LDFAATHFWKEELKDFVTALQSLQAVAAASQSLDLGGLTKDGHYTKSRWDLRGSSKCCKPGEHGRHSRQEIQSRQ